jgi:hypothetical protein
MLTSGNMLTPKSPRRAAITVTTPCVATDMRSSHRGV